MQEPFRVGDEVRFSEVGRLKVRSMPEAWGLHRALYGDEIGEVIGYDPPADDECGQLSVEFSSGAAYYWDADCFQLASPLPVEEPPHEARR
ncbi:MAG: hypothetical protein K0Q72_575 [Armatimonadetes bacterium]|jgi:hypothetical protein|nr:hypothetical protein [Armatimonadota bacterium]